MGHASIKDFWHSLRALPANLWGSVIRRGRVDTELRRAEVMNQNFFLHVMPTSVHRNTLMFSYTLGLGTIACVLFLILIGTGIILMFYYVPTVDQAYWRMKDLEFVVSNGMLVRNLHRWAAHGMVAAVFLHMCRVFYTGSFHPPREFNWIIGVVLLVLTLGLSFTGYLLPWDQLAFWAITVGSGIVSYFPVVGRTLRFVLLGGNQVGQEAVLRFYVLHIAILPTLALIIIGVHFWRIRKDGGLSRPEEPDEAPAPETAKVPDKSVGQEIFPHDPRKTYGLMELVRGTSPMVDRGPENTLSAWPHLVFRVFALSVLTLLILMIVSLIFDAPLKEIANPSIPENPAKAPWYFLGLQELVSYSAFIGGVFVPTLTVFALMLIPYVDRDSAGTGLWFHSRRARRIALVSAILTVAVVSLLLFAEMRTGGLRHFYADAPQWLIDIFNPGTLTVTYLVVLFFIVVYLTDSLREASIGLFTGFMIAFSVFTVIGTFLRGPNWKFYWFWQSW
jgi:quinol-cytochrome oxidoreductase complex cytochrome b subunit